MLAGLCLADAPQPRDLSGGDWEVIMPAFSPELIQTMRAALEEAMTRVPVEQASPGISRGARIFLSGLRTYSDFRLLS
jgi:hypothetical protein